MPAKSGESSSAFVISTERRGCRFPDNRVAKQRRRRREVAANRREVERRHGVDEALERAVLHLVPDAGTADRLLVIELLREVRVEAPEVDHFRGGIDLGLKRRLRLPEHRRGVHRRTPGGGQQFRGAQQHGGAVLPWPCGPLAARGRGGGDGLLDLLGTGEMVIGEHVRVIVRHHRMLDSAGVDLASADDQRNFDLLGRHRFQTRLQLRALWRAGGVGVVGLVDRLRNSPNAGECRVERDAMPGRRRHRGRMFFGWGGRSVCGHSVIVLRAAGLHSLSG